MEIIKRFVAAGLQGAAAFFVSFSPVFDAGVVHQEDGYQLMRGHFYLSIRKEFIRILKTWLSGGEDCTAASLLNNIHRKAGNH